MGSLEKIDNCCNHLIYPGVLFGKKSTLLNEKGQKGQGECLVAEFLERQLFQVVYYLLLR